VGAIPYRGRREEEEEGGGKVWAHTYSSSI